MPHETYLVSPRPMTLADLVEAAGEVDGSLALRVLDDGGSLQLVDTDDVATITIDQSRELQVTTDAERLVGPLPGAGERWWTAATTPWGPSGDQGRHVVDELSVLLGATTVTSTLG